MMNTPSSSVSQEIRVPARAKRAKHDPSFVEATRHSERISAIKKSETQAITEQQPQYASKPKEPQTSRNPQARARKRSRDVEGTTSSKRPRKLEKPRSSLQKHPPENPASEGVISNIDDNTYVPEFEHKNKYETYVNRYFKCTVPVASKISQAMVQFEAENGRRMPRSDLIELMRPLLLKFVGELNQRPTRYRALLMELWDLKDEWIYPVDDVFPKPFFKQIAQSVAHATSWELCKRCSSLDINQPVNLPSSETRSDSCGLCRMLSQRYSGSNNGSKTPLIESRSLVRICAAPGSHDAHPRIQIGFPTLPESGPRFEILRKWLRYCDERHETLGCHLRSTPRLPTRVLDVGDGNLRLHISVPDERGDYIVLSHCWGNLSEEQKKTFCLSCDNIDSWSREGIDLGSLPKTFQDAITVTRQLGKRYLWIDSLCIVQYGDNLSDWTKESELMGAVFGNAYCTIAATSAADPAQGFLLRPTTANSEPKFVKVHSPSYGPVYISSLVDDFQGDVESGILNQRAWVLQERALSRRTIHFTATQAYWECGNGVRCETMTVMRK